MRTDDFIRAIDSLTPGKELKAKIMEIAERPTRARLERPGRLVAVFGAATALCMCIAVAVVILNHDGEPNADIVIPPATSQAGPASDFETTASYTVDVQTATAAKTASVTPAPTPIPKSIKLKNDYPKLMDVLKITEKDGKCYANDEYLLYVSNFPAYGFDENWLKKLKDGELTKAQILAETALADERAANYMTPFIKKTLPEGIIKPEAAVTIAKKAYLDYFDIDAGDCVLIDDFSYSISTVLGSTEIAEPLYQKNAFAGKKMILVMFNGSDNSGKGTTEAEAPPPYWYFQFLSDGAAGSNIEDVQISLNAITGDVVFGSLHGYGPVKNNYSKNELKQRAALARQYVEKKEILKQASVTKVENMNFDSDVSVSLSDGRVIIVTIDEDMIVQGFSVK